MKTFTYYLLLFLNEAFKLDNEGLGAISHLKERGDEMKRQKLLNFSNNRSQF